MVVFAKSFRIRTYVSDILDMPSTGPERAFLSILAILTLWKWAVEHALCQLSEISCK
jgi:hypothetical protein